MQGNRSKSWYFHHRVSPWRYGFNAAFFFLLTRYILVQFIHVTTESNSTLKLTASPEGSNTLNTIYAKLYKIHLS